MRPSPATRRLLAWAAALAVLGAVFAAYLQPTLMVELANQMWACF
ncbi:hypothetical protein [uncultured Aquincola sp.]